MNTLDFRFESPHFYLGDKPFFPFIKDVGSLLEDEEEFNAAVVRLSLDVCSDLDWTSQLQEARELQEKQMFIVWEFDFGLGNQTISLTDSATFLSFSLGLEQFSKTVWPEFSEVTLGAIFYRGDLEFSSRFFWSRDQEDNFALWFENMLPQEAIDVGTFLTEKTRPFVIQVYCLSVLMEYLHRLLSYLPDAVQAFCLFDAEQELELAKLAQLFSKERFSHFHLGVKGSRIPLAGIVYEDGQGGPGFLGARKASQLTLQEATLGICLPSDEVLFSTGLESLERVLEKCKEANMIYRIIPESLLTQEWMQLEAIVYFSHALTTFGKRSLQGFYAAGGDLVYYGNKGNFAEESSFEDYMKKESE